MNFVITEISSVGPTAFDLTPDGRFVLFSNGNGAWTRADLQGGGTTPAPFGMQITDDGAAVVTVDGGSIVRTEVATGTAVTRTLPAGWNPLALTSIDGLGGRVGVSATNAALGDDGAYVVAMATGASSLVDSTVPGAQQGDRSRNPVLSADGSIVAFDRSASGAPDSTGVWVSVSGGPATLISAPPSSSVRSTVQDMSADGRFVLFWSTVTHTSGRLHVHDRTSGSTTEVPLVPAGGRTAPATISDDGQRVGLAVDRTVEGSQLPVPALHNRVSGATTVMTADNTIASTLWLDQPVQISANGRRAVFAIIGPEEEGPRIVRADFSS